MATPSTLAPTTTTPFSLPSFQKPTVSHNAAVWLALLSVSAILGLSIAVWLLLRYTCTRAGRQEGQNVADGRNKHRQWWRHKNPPSEDASMADSSTLELANLTRHAAPLTESWPATTSWPLPSRGLGVKSRYYANGYLRNEPL